MTKFIMDNNDKHLLQNPPYFDDALVKILKEKKGVPTVIEWNGKRYVLHHADQLKR